MPEPIYSIYRIRCKVTGKSYIGCSQHPGARYIAHMNGTAETRNSSKAIGFDVERFGKDVFELSILEWIDTKLLAYEREKYWIYLLNTLCPNGYNLTSGGLGCPGHEITEKQKELISKNRKGKGLGNGNHHPDDYIYPQSICITNVYTGKTYSTVKEAARSTHTSEVNIRLSCQLSRQIGRIWYKYTEDKHGK